LAEKYPSFKVVNLGVGAETSAQINARKTQVNAYAPFRVIVWTGVNDVYANATAVSIETNLQPIYSYYADMGYEVVALTIPPRDTDTAARNIVKAAVNDWIKNTATSITTIVDAWTIIADPADTTKRLPAYAANDSVSTSHINDAGFAAIVAVM
jgi:hypothetical protein